VDAGHGGHDPGAVRLPSEEKAFTLQMCQELKHALEQRGAHVVMTRDADSYVTLDQRCDIANGCHADLFISIHLNSLNPPARGNGSETYFHTPQSVRLAHFLHPRLVSAVGERDGGIHNQRFYVVRNTSMPSVLLEVAYISNSDEVRLMSRPGFGANLAQSLTRGILAYYGKEVRSASGQQ
jgi:N-acetylmuramoyl-L-alanine amidase